MTPRRSTRNSWARRRKATRNSRPRTSAGRAIRFVPGAVRLSAPPSCVSAQDAPASPTMTRNELLDLYFMDARAKLIDIAAFLDRVDCGKGGADFRLAAFRQAMKELAGENPARAKAVL